MLDKKNNVSDDEGSKGIFVSCDWLIYVCVKYEMLDFGVMKCDLFCTHEACFSLKNAP